MFPVFTFKGYNKNYDRFESFFTNLSLLFIGLSSTFIYNMTYEANNKLGIVASSTIVLFCIIMGVIFNTIYFFIWFICYFPFFIVAIFIPNFIENILTFLQICEDNALNFYRRYERNSNNNRVDVELINDEFLYML